MYILDPEGNTIINQLCIVLVGLGDDNNQIELYG